MFSEISVEFVKFHEIFIFYFLLQQTPGGYVNVATNYITSDFLKTKKLKIMNFGN
jgi:hypothetical protein